VRPLAADLGFLPVLVFWGVMILVGRSAQAKKKREMEARRLPEQRDLASFEPHVTHVARELPPEPAAQFGMMDELRRAMEELKRAELQTRAHDEAPRVIAAPAPRVSVTHQQVRRVPDTTRRPIYVEQKPRIETAEQAFEEGQGARIAASAKKAPAAQPKSTAPETVAIRNPLAKFADGSAKSALILSTILGRPLSEQPPDA
jgi:hypothetical protein